MSSLSAHVAGLDEVIGEFAAMPPQIDRASRRAVNKTAKWAAREIARGVAADDRLPLRLLYRASASGGSWRRVMVSGARRAGSQASVWVGINPVKAAYVGALRQLRSGARAGQHFFDRAFVATMKSGHRGIYLRRGRGRLPIEEQTVSLTSAPRHAESVRQRIPARLSEVLQQELNYEVNVRGAG